MIDWKDCKRAYIKLKEEKGRKPKRAEFCEHVGISRRMFGRLFGNNAYSKLQSECGDDPNKLILERTPLEEILIQYGSLVRTTEGLPTGDDWDSRKCKPTVAGINKPPHNLKWSEMPIRFLEYAKDKPE